VPPYANHTLPNSTQRKAMGHLESLSIEHNELTHDIGSLTHTGSTATGTLKV
jgi:hypothetical protein